MFSVVTDTSHTAGLTMHATILAYMLTLVETNKVTVSLNPQTPTLAAGATAAQVNITYVQDFVANLLRTAFPHLTDNQVRTYIYSVTHPPSFIEIFWPSVREFPRLVGRYCS